MRIEMSTRIEAPTTVVWSLLADVEDWPQWTASTTSVERLDVGYFGAGSRVRIKQPRFPAVVWIVTHFERGHSFTWKATSFGLTTEATHQLEAASGGASTVTLTLEQTGALSSWMSLLFGRRSRRYVQMELDGLKREAESFGA